VAAGLRAGVRVIGVANERYSREVLLDAGASAVVDELDELEPLL
jgi:phosphoglycolate phosphatase-like HAD superfamily hydrolase